jgi:uncharacterized membrane protein
MNRNLIKPKKNIILGVTLPEEAHTDERVTALCRMFIQWHNTVMLPLLPLIIPPFFFETMGGAMTWFMTWLLFLIAAPMAVFAVYHGKLMALKRGQGWQGKTAGPAFADIKTIAALPKKVSFIWFLLPVTASVIPVADVLRKPSEPGLMPVLITFAVMSLFFWWFYTLIFRLKAEAVNPDRTLTMALTRIRRAEWSKFWLIAVWLNAGLNLTIWAAWNNFTLFMAAILAYTLLLIGAGVYAEFSARFAQQKLTAQNVGAEYLDEDDYWIWGIFYHNPNDRHLLVNDRIGMNMSINLAKTGGKALMGLALLCTVALPFVGVWMMAEESVPSKLELTETELIARHTRDVYVIPLNTIESAELIDELETLYKTNGTNFDNLYKGQFSVKGYGAARLCLQPKDPPFLVITADGKTYIVNDADSSVTEMVYVEILKFRE